MHSTSRWLVGSSSSSTSGRCISALASASLFLCPPDSLSTGRSRLSFSDGSRASTALSARFCTSQAPCESILSEARSNFFCAPSPPPSESAAAAASYSRRAVITGEFPAYKASLIVIVWPTRGSCSTYAKTDPLRRVTVPPSGGSCCDRILRRVLFPTPLTPIKPTLSPLESTNVASWN
mmetsp:Transcript_9391/g.21726  ORF Transcript_9391/g.21726 Transcript_9391/m.21726 type:complete len:179 (-) Transcript_9391:318-854(-)